MSLQSSYSSTSSVCPAAGNTVLILFDSLLSHSPRPCFDHPLSWSFFKASWLAPPVGLTVITDPGGMTFWFYTHVLILAICHFVNTLKTVECLGKLLPARFPCWSPGAKKCLHARRPNYWISITTFYNTSLMNLNVHWKLPHALLEPDNLKWTRDQLNLLKVTATELPREKIYWLGIEEN